MRILWITNQPIPFIAEEMGMIPGVGGGWMIEISKQVAKTDTLALAFPVSSSMQYKEGNKNGVFYYAIPMNKIAVKPDDESVEYFKDTLKKFNPDIIHIWGTEYIHTFCAVLACEQLGMLGKTVISIQGLVSVYAQHFYGYIEKKEIITTLKDLIYGGGIRDQMHSFVKRGKYEIESLKKVKHVIGRTDWDQACTTQINPDINYHFCNETLRNSFYEKQWDFEKCEKHSLFVSQSHYPLKGFHHALVALSILKRKWPDVRLYTTGRNLLLNNAKEKLLDNGYECYIRKLITELSLENNIVFLGRLEEKEMCERFCKTHVFVSPSSIENSPNSVGEAMYLGVPVVTSDVGGVKNLLLHEVEGYVYQPDAPYMLAYYISRIFESDDLAQSISQKGRERAFKIFDKENNLKTLLGIYTDIMSDLND